MMIAKPHLVKNFQQLIIHELVHSSQSADSFQKEDHGQIGQLFFTLKNNHDQFIKVNKLDKNVIGSHLYRIASRRFDYYYNKEISEN